LETTKYIYHGDPENSTEWSMLSSDLGQYANFPIASSTYGMFNEGEEIIFDLAHIFTQNETLDNIETVSEAKLDIAIIQELYEEKFITECSINTESIASQSIGFSIYPNPSKHMISIQGTDTYDRYEIWNNLGQKVAVGSSTENIFIGEYVSGLYHIKIFKDDDYFNASFIKD